MTRDQLMTALHRAIRSVSGQGVLYSQALAERLGINSTDLECLDVVMMNGPLTAGELARSSGLTAGAITGVIDRLDRAGFVAREPDAQDRRKVLVRALPAALQTAETLTRPMAEGSAALLSAYDDAALALILDFLRQAHEGAVAATATLRAEAATIGARKAKPGRP